MKGVLRNFHKFLANLIKFLRTLFFTKHLRTSAFIFSKKFANVLVKYFDVNKIHGTAIFRETFI